MIRYKLFFIITLIAALAACNDNLVIEPEEDLNPGGNDIVTFTMVQQQLFNTTCALSGCHAGSFPAAGMNLEEGNAYTEIVNVTSKLNTNFKIVSPGSSTNSFIIKMLKNTGENTRIMPPSGKLSEGTIQFVEKWINNGAKND